MPPSHDKTHGHTEGIRIDALTTDPASVTSESPQKRSHPELSEGEAYSDDTNPNTPRDTDSELFRAAKRMRADSLDPAAGDSTTEVSHLPPAAAKAESLAEIVGFHPHVAGEASAADPSLAAANPSTKDPFRATDLIEDVSCRPDATSTERGLQSVNADSHPDTAKGLTEGVDAHPPDDPEPQESDKAFSLRLEVDMDETGQWVISIPEHTHVVRVKNRTHSAEHGDVFPWNVGVDMDQNGEWVVSIPELVPVIGGKDCQEMGC